MINTAKLLFEELDKDFKPNTRRPELGEFTELRRCKDERVEFSIGWYKEFIISFKPKTVGVKYIVTDKQTKEHKTLSKSYPLEQENLLDAILELLNAEIK